MKKLRIGIVGIGAVGGYFGGWLARKYFKSAEAEITFIARPETAAVLRESGLLVETPTETFRVFADCVASTAAEIGELDVLLCAVKSYDLEAALEPLRPCITAETWLVPLLNGIDAPDRLRALFPDARVANGCVYLVARRTAPGVICETGNIHNFHFGAAESDARLDQLHALLQGAGIRSFLEANILQTVWEKYFFIAPLASLTSYADATVGALLADANHRARLLQLQRETQAVAAAQGIRLSDELLAETVAKMERLPFATTSSMHSDFQQGKRTELDSLTGRVVALGAASGVAVPVYDQVFAALKLRQSLAEDESTSG